LGFAHFAYPQRDGQAELAWTSWGNTKMVYARMVTHLSTNLAQCQVTSLMQTNNVLMRLRINN